MLCFFIGGDYKDKLMIVIGTSLAELKFNRHSLIKCRYNTTILPHETAQDIQYNILLLNKSESY